MAGRGVRATVVGTVAEAVGAGPEDAPRGVVLLATGGAGIASLAEPFVLASSIADAAGRLAAAQAACAALGDARLALVTRGGQGVPGPGAVPDPVQAALWGVRHCIAVESPTLASIAIDLDPFRPEPDAGLVADWLAGRAQEDRIAVRGGASLAQRLERTESDAARDAGLGETFAVPGASRIDDLVASPAPRRAPGAGEVELRVRAVGLNLRDVLKVLGRYPEPDTRLGDECAATVVAVGPDVRDFAPGDEVMGVMPGCLGTHVTGSPATLVHRPRGLSPEQAAAIPVAFATASIALEQVASLRRGERVLVHAGAGGVGSAAVRIALAAGAEVYATAGTPEKRRALERLGVRGAFDSRSTAFREALLAATGGRGVDVVLNSLAGEFIAASLDVLRPGGRFVEIGRTGTWSEERVAALGRDIAYHVLFLARDRDERPAAFRAMLRGLVERILAGTLALPPIDAIPAEGLRDAMRHMAQGRHVGKLVIRMDRSPAPVPIRPDASYLVTGGTGGLGQATAARLLDLGAGAVLLAARDPGVPTDVLTGRGARVESVAVDLAAPGAVEALEAALASLPPLGGIVHAAGVLDDAPLEQMSHRRWLAPLGPKLGGLAAASALAARHPLDFVLCYSAGAALFGAPGQANYAAANAAMDACVAVLRAAGAPVTSVQWGVWAEIGMTARLTDRQRDRMAARGFDTLDPDAALHALAGLAGAPGPSVAVLAARWDDVAASLPASARGFVERLRGTGEAAMAASVPSEGPTRPALRESVSGLPEGARRAALLERLEALARRALEYPPTRPVPDDVPLRDLGLDSLMAIELRNAVAAAWGAALPVTLLFDHPTVRALADHLLARLEAGGAPAGPSSPAMRGLDRALAELSDDEAEALLLKELDTAPGDTTHG